MYRWVIHTFRNLCVVLWPKFLKFGVNRMSEMSTSAWIAQNLTDIMTPYLTLDATRSRMDYHRNDNPRLK